MSGDTKKFFIIIDANWYQSSCSGWFLTLLALPNVHKTVSPYQLIFPLKQLSETSDPVDTNSS